MWEMYYYAVLTFFHCSKSGGKNKAPVVHYTLVGPRKWSVKCCHIPVVCIYGNVSRPSGVDNAVVVAPVDVWPPTTDNGFHSRHFTREANGLSRNQSAIQRLCQQNCWAWSNVVRSLWFCISYRNCRVTMYTSISITMSGRRDQLKWLLTLQFLHTMHIYIYKAQTKGNCLQLIVHLVGLNTCTANVLSILLVRLYYAPAAHSYSTCSA